MTAYDHMEPFTDETVDPRWFPPARRPWWLRLLGALCRRWTDVEVVEERTVTVTIEVDLSGFTGAMHRVAEAARAFGRVVRQHHADEVRERRELAVDRRRAEHPQFGGVQPSAAAWAAHDG